MMCNVFETLQDEACEHVYIIKTVIMDRILIFQSLKRKLKLIFLHGYDFKIINGSLFGNLATGSNVVQVNML